MAQTTKKFLPNIGILSEIPDIKIVEGLSFQFFQYLVFKTKNSSHSEKFSNPT